MVPSSSITTRPTPPPVPPPPTRSRPSSILSDEDLAILEEELPSIKPQASEDTDESLTEISPSSSSGPVKVPGSAPSTESENSGTLSEDKIAALKLELDLKPLTPLDAYDGAADVAKPKKRHKRRSAMVIGEEERKKAQAGKCLNSVAVFLPFTNSMRRSIHSAFFAFTAKAAE